MIQNFDCQLSDLQTESDVEQKFINQLLQTSGPTGLNYGVSDFSTKKDLRKIVLGKGDKAKLYYPDYVIINSGLPLAVIEVKRPEQDLKEAYYEARLYASELNALYSSKINPCNKILASNGKETVYGYYDSSEPLGAFYLSDVTATNERFGQFIDFFNKRVVFAESEEILKNIRKGTKFTRPTSLLGGKSVQNEELRPNSFGSTISLEFRNLFNPETKEDKQDIVNNAYVTTRRLLRHLDPIEKIIKSSIPLFSNDFTQIKDTSEPHEITSKFKNRRQLRNQLLLLIGGVGAGKSTFTEYLQQTALNDDIKSNSVWVTINMNIAPLGRDEIYVWLKKQLVKGLEKVYEDLDFEIASTLLKIFAVEFNKLEKGPASFFIKNSDKYNELYANKLDELSSDLDAKCKAYVRYFCGERDKLLVVVLDNCDKRDLEDQLLMFDVSNWLKEEYNACVFLPLRDTTYDNFKKQKPLDTVINDLVFRIDPPLLREVIYARIKYALRLLSKGRSTLSFELENGFRVDYPASEQGFFLASIVRSLFDNTYFNKLIAGLAGRDIRKGLSIFLDFCKSGHINEGEILKIKQTKGTYILQNHLIATVLLKGNRKYYSDGASNVKNLFANFPEEDTIPNPFCRISILRWLDNRRSLNGPNKTKGYHSVEDLIQTLTRIGHNQDRVKKELNTLIGFKCIVTETQKEEFFEESELISITASGIVHLELLRDVNYIAACSEDSWYRTLQTAMAIKENITFGKGGVSPMSKQIVFDNAKLLLEYLREYKNNFLITFDETQFLTDSKATDINIDEILELLDKFNSDEGKDEVLQKYPVGTRVECEIVAKKEYGFFVQFGINGTGLIHISSIEKYGFLIEDFDIGQVVTGEILDYKTDHNRFNVELVIDIS